MERFQKRPEDKWGLTVISDIENTEPVCTIYSKYHPYASDLILEALNKVYPEIDPEVKKIWGIEEG